MLHINWLLAIILGYALVAFGYVLRVIIEGLKYQHAGVDPAGEGTDKSAVVTMGRVTGGDFITQVNKLKEHYYSDEDFDDTRCVMGSCRRDLDFPDQNDLPLDMRLPKQNIGEPCGSCINLDKPEQVCSQCDGINMYAKGVRSPESRLGSQSCLECEHFKFGETQICKKCKDFNNFKSQ